MTGTVMCPDCGLGVEPGQFCTECGASLPAQPEPSTTATPTATAATPGTAEAAPAAAARPSWWRRRRNLLVVAGGTVAAVLIAGGVVTALQATGAEAVKTASATAMPSGARVLPGWSNTAAWTASGVQGRVGVTADGRLLGSATGPTVTVRTASTGTVLRTTTLDRSARGGVFAATVDGRPALVAYTATTLTTWSGKTAAPHTVTLPKGGTVQIRTGAVFVTAGTAVSVLEEGLVPVTSPRSGAAVLGRTDDGRILWASARGEVITAAINGTILHTAALARPAKDATLDGWQAATSAVVWVRWKRSGKPPVLVAHRVDTGAAITTTTPLPDGVTTTSQDGTGVLVDGVWFTRDGKVRPMPEEFVASRFVGGAVYGATTAGDAALLTGSRLQSAGIPDVVPVAVTAGRDLVTVTGGHIATYPPTTK